MFHFIFNLQSFDYLKKLLYMLITEIELLQKEIQSILDPYGIVSQISLTKQTLLIILNRDIENQVDYPEVTTLLKKYLTTTEIVKKEPPKGPVYGDRKLTPDDYKLAKTGFEKDRVRVLGRISKAPKSEYETSFDLLSTSKASQSNNLLSPVPKESEQIDKTTEIKIKCPKCQSSQIASFQKGFGWGKAVGGALLFGPLGLAAGGIGSKKITLGCLSCGHKWMAGS